MLSLDQELKGLQPIEAAYYARLGLLLEVFTLADISDWVDDVLLMEEAPANFFLQLYRLLRTDKQEVMAYLDNAFPVMTFSVRPALAWLQQLLTNRACNLKQIIRSLYRLRTLTESDLEVGWIYGLAADYERCSRGSADAISEVYRETEMFLGCYQEYTFANRSQWLYLDALLAQRLANIRH